jgi:hypothetical protein
MPTQSLHLHLTQINTCKPRRSIYTYTYHTPTLSLSLTHTHTHTHTLKYIYTFWRSVYTLSLTEREMHTFYNLSYAYTYTYTHTYTHTHTHTHTIQHEQSKVYLASFKPQYLIIFVAYERVLYGRVSLFTRLKSLAKDKQSSLLGPLFTYEEKTCC